MVERNDKQRSQVFERLPDDTHRVQETTEQTSDVSQTDEHVMEAEHTLERDYASEEDQDE